MSWADEIAAAPQGIEQAKVMLSQAQHKGSKSRAHALIEGAIRESGADVSVSGLLDLYGLAYSLDGLRECAKCFAKDLSNPSVRREWFSIYQ